MLHRICKLFHCHPCVFRRFFHRNPAFLHLFYQHLDLTKLKSLFSSQLYSFLYPFLYPFLSAFFTRLILFLTNMFLLVTGAFVAAM